MEKSKAELYIEKYKELEEAVRTTYKLTNQNSISYYLSSQEKFKYFRDEIQYCQDIRNLLQHKKKINNSYPIEPAPETIDFISTLIDKVRNRKKCSDICIKFSDIFYMTLNDSVKYAMSIMKSNMFTCVPILDSRKVIGVFDENSLFEYISRDEIVEISPELTFRDISDYLDINNREMEEFIFFNSQNNVDELEIEFEKCFKKGKRISAVFLTPSGKPTEDIVGLITAWDILGYKK